MEYYTVLKKVWRYGVRVQATWFISNLFLGDKWKLLMIEYITYGGGKQVLSDSLTNF